MFKNSFLQSVTIKRIYCQFSFESTRDCLTADKMKLALFIAVQIIHCVSKNATDVAHYNFDADQPILVILAEMLLREYAVKWWFAIPPLLTNVSTLPGET